MTVRRIIQRLFVSVWHHKIAGWQWFTSLMVACLLQEMSVLRLLKMSLNTSLFHDTVSCLQSIECQFCSICAEVYISYTSSSLSVGKTAFFPYQRKNSITKRLFNEKNIRDNLGAQDSRLDFFAVEGFLFLVNQSNKT